MTFKDIIENSKKNKTSKIYGVISDKGLIREYDCIIVPIKHTLFECSMFSTCNYKMTLTSKNGYTKVVELHLTEKNLNASQLYVNFPQLWLYYIDKKQALEEAFSTYASIREDGEYLRENIIEFADEETLKRIRESDEYVNKRRKELKNRNVNLK